MKVWTNTLQTILPPPKRTGLALPGILFKEARMSMRLMLIRSRFFAVTCPRLIPLHITLLTKDLLHSVLKHQADINLYILKTWLAGQILALCLVFNFIAVKLQTVLFHLHLPPQMENNILAQHVAHQVLLDIVWKHQADINLHILRTWSAG